MPVLNARALIDTLVGRIRNYHDTIGVPKAELDLSGGIDSAVMAGLLSKALGPENVIVVHSKINSNPEHEQRARECAETFGLKLVVIDLTDTYMNLVDDMIEAYCTAQDDPAATNRDLQRRLRDDPTILGSIRSTIRAPIGRGFNRLFGGGIRHGTGNECEDRWMRFYQKGGDGEVDSNPIAMLSKGEVFQLARALGVPESILTARPSPDLWGVGDDHNDEDEIANYLDFKASDYGQTFYSYINTDTGEYTSVGLIERVSRFLDDNEYGEDLFLDGRSDGYLRRCLNAADEHPAFTGVPADLVETVLTAARRVEKTTRHKFNPNCPTLGSRSELVEAGALTDDLPTL